MEDGTPSSTLSLRPSAFGLCGWTLLLLLGLGNLLGAAAAPTLPARAEMEFQAVYLLKIARFITWPARAFTNASAPILIAVVAPEPFPEILAQALANETVGPRKLLVRPYAASGEIPHILYLSDGEADRWPAVRVSLGTNAVLTVSDQAHFNEQGGIVQFFKTRDTLQFNIAQPAARAAGLAIDARLMRLSRPVPAN
jgi:hypothetical protein